jgi:hypothetical protein
LLSESKGSRAAGIGATKATHNRGPYGFGFHAAKYEPPTFWFVAA